MAGADSICGIGLPEDGTCLYLEEIVLEEEIVGAVERMLKVDMRLANEVADESEQLRKDGEKLIEQIMTHRVKFAVLFARVVESLERTALYSVDIAEIAINLAEKA